MKGYQSLVRLSRWRVDERRRTLADLEQLTRDLRARLRTLQEQFEAEQEVVRASPVVSVDYVAYAATMKQRRKTLENTLADVNRQIEDAREDVAAAHRELKKYELAEESRLALIDKQAARDQQVALDEVALSIFRRRT